MSSRRRRRSNWKKKLKRSRDAGEMQVDLLGDEAAASADEPDDGATEGAGADNETLAQTEEEASKADESLGDDDEDSYRPPPMRLRFEFVEPEEAVRSTVPPAEVPKAPARDEAAAAPHAAPGAEELTRAKDLVQRGRVQEAVDMYLGLLGADPSNLKARNNLGVLLDELKQHEAALEHFEAAERVAPENVEVLTNLASTLTSVARYDRADAVLRRAQRIDPENLEVRLAIGILYFRRGLYAQSEAELRWVCARARDNGPAFYYRGEALNRLGRFDEAGVAMEQAKALLPDDPRPYYTLGHLYDRKSQFEEAAEMYRHARRLQTR